MVHRDIVGYCIADKLTRAATVLGISDRLQELCIPSPSVNFNIVQSFYEEAECDWMRENACNIVKLRWTPMDMRRTHSLLSLINMAIYTSYDDDPYGPLFPFFVSMQIDSNFN